MENNRVRRTIDIEILGDHPDYVRAVIAQELDECLQRLIWPGVVVRVLDPLSGPRCPICEGTGRSPKLYEYRACKNCRGLGYLPVPPMPKEE